VQIEVDDPEAAGAVSNIAEAEKATLVNPDVFGKSEVSSPVVTPPPPRPKKKVTKKRVVTKVVEKSETVSSDFPLFSSRIGTPDFHHEKH
jgi:hypothetical protein